MTYAQIEELLARFMQGTTTLEEEARLARYFRTAADVPQEWEDYREMFAFIEAGCLGGHAERRKLLRPLYYALSGAVAILALVFFLFWPKEESQELAQAEGMKPALPAASPLPAEHDTVEVVLAESLERQKEQNRASLRSRRHVPQQEDPEPILFAVLEEQLPDSAPVVAPSFSVEQEPLVASANPEPMPLTDDQLLDLHLALIERRVAEMEHVGDALLDDTDLLTGSLILTNETINP